MKRDAVNGPKNDQSPRKKPKDANKLNKALIHAVLNNPADIPGLLQQGADPLYEDGQALMVALPNQVATLLEKFKDVMLIRGITHLLTLTSNKEMILHLVEHYHLTLDGRNRTGVTPLMVACGEANLDMVQWLIENKANQFMRDPIHGFTPLLFAVIGSVVYGDEKVVQYLLENQSCSNERSTKGQTALLLACEVGSDAVVKLLLEKNYSSVHERGTEPPYPSSLSLACKFNHSKIAKILLWHLDNSPDSDSMKAEALMDAVEGGYLELVLILFEHQTKINWDHVKLAALGNVAVFAELWGRWIEQLGRSGDKLPLTGTTGAALLFRLMSSGCPTGDRADVTKQVLVDLTRNQVPVEIGYQLPRQYKPLFEDFKQFYPYIDTWEKFRVVIIRGALNAVDHFVVDLVELVLQYSKPSGDDLFKLMKVPRAEKIYLGYLQNQLNKPFGSGN